MTGPAGGGGSSTAQVFRYVATGNEGTVFPVILPAARASANYNVQVTPGGPQANTIKIPRANVASFTLVGFDLELSAPPQAGDIYMITVEDLT